MEEQKRCYNDALRLIARRDYSVYKLAKKLREKGHERGVIDNTIDELISQNYLKEELYKEARIKGLLRKGYAIEVVSIKMSQEMCPASIEEIQNVAYEAGMGNRDQLRELIEKKVRIDYDFVNDKRKLKERVLRYIHSRGHSVSRANSLYDSILEEFQSKEL